MKYVIVIPDGCADEPQGSLGGKTPLQAARTPAMDEIARVGIVGRASHVPPHLPAGSDVANLSLFGYDPDLFFTGRAPLEAAAQGIDLGDGDWAIRCNLVTVEGQRMRDFTADHISSSEAATLLHEAQSAEWDPHLQFVPGVSYRNLLIYRARGESAPFSRDTQTTPPHDLTDRSVGADYPRGPGSQLLEDWMAKSVPLFAEHPVNRQRLSAGKLPATNVWLWGLGQAPRLPTFLSRHGKQGLMITAVDLLRGLAALMGWQRVEVPGATGYTDTDYRAKGRYAVAALPTVDLVCVHIEATDEASHEGDVHAKVAALEAIDEYIVAPLWNALTQSPEYRILVSPDHPTPLRTKTHSHGSVPFAMAGTGIHADEAMSYDEIVANRSARNYPEGWRLMGDFLNS